MTGITKWMTNWLFFPNVPPGSIWKKTVLRMMSTHGTKKLFEKNIKQWHHEDFHRTTGQVLFSHVWYGSIFSAWNSMSPWSNYSVKGLIFPIVVSWSGGKYLMKPFHLRFVHSTVRGGRSGSWEAAYAIRYSLPRWHNDPEQKHHLP